MYTNTELFLQITSFSIPQNTEQLELPNRNMPKKRKITSYQAKRKPKKNVYEGILKVDLNNRSMLVTETGSFYVHETNRHGAFDGDRVIGRVFGRERTKEARIYSVLERAFTTFVGSYFEVETGQGLLRGVQPLDDKMNTDFFLETSDTTPELCAVEHNDVVLARIVAYPSKKTAGIATIQKHLGAQESFDMHIEKAIAEAKIPTAFSEEALAEAQSFTDNVAEVFKREPKRVDFRAQPCVTIDPADARDFDDAVYIEQNKNGNFTLYVHIADVSHFVQINSTLDKEALERGSSAYLVDRVIPMLPEELSNDLCSLKPGVDRLAMSVVITADKTGNVLSYEVCKSAIRSEVSLSYDEVDEFLKTGDSSVLINASEHKAELGQMLLVLQKFMHARHTLYEKRGALEFETPEVRVVLNDEGKMSGVSVRVPTEATQMIEYAMLAANECVARFLSDRKLNACYRVREAPDPDALWKALPILHEFKLIEGDEGYRFTMANPFVMQNVLAKAKKSTANVLVSSLLLRTQARAVYRPQNDGHYALGAAHYCHFTSPIRRYPDLVVHRKVKAVLSGTEYSKEEKKIDKKLEEICDKASSSERITAALSKRTHKIKLAQYYQTKKDELLHATVNSVASYGMFVCVNDTLAEGLIPMNELEDDWYEYDEVKMRLVGEATGKVWRVGDAVDVMVKAVDIQKGYIDFKLAKQAGSKHN